jgi:hypothetical protein
VYILKRCKGNERANDYDMCTIAHTNDSAGNSAPSIVQSTQYDTVATRNEIRNMDLTDFVDVSSSKNDTSTKNQTAAFLSRDLEDWNVEDL